MAHDVYEEFRASGKELIDKAKEILQEGNVRRMVIKNRDGETLFKLPLTVGVVGVGGAFALAPILSTIAAFAFFVHDARILVERYPDDARSGLVNHLGDDHFDDDHLGDDPFDDDHLGDDPFDDGHSDKNPTASGNFDHNPSASGHFNKKHSKAGKSDPYEIDADFKVVKP